MKLAGLLFIEDKIYAGVAKESQLSGYGSNGSCEGIHNDEFSTGIVNAEEELRRALLENELLMTTFKEYKVRVKNSKQKLQEEKLTGLLC